MHTSTSAEFLFNMPLIDFIQFHSDLCNEAERAIIIRKEAMNRIGK